MPSTNTKKYSNGGRIVPVSLIQLQDVSKSFFSTGREFEALNSVNLEFVQGEYTGIVGKSGSGKSTLLNLISGIDNPTEGKVKIDDVSLDSLNESELSNWRGRNVGIVFQFFQLMPTLTIRENLLLPLDFVNKVHLNDRDTHVERLLGEMNISHLADKRPTELSGGEQQRAAIARALVNDPAILIADEPTGNLDSETSADIVALFERLSLKGVTVLVVTHDVSYEHQFDRVIRLKDGSVASDGLEQPESAMIS
jgi:putative ABC transport system ATP-binding protein